MDIAGAVDPYGLYTGSTACVSLTFWVEDAYSSCEERLPPAFGTGDGRENEVGVYDERTMEANEEQDPPYQSERCLRLRERQVSILSRLSTLSERLDAIAAASVHPSCAGPSPPLSEKGLASSSNDSLIVASKRAWTTAAAPRRRQSKLGSRQKARALPDAGDASDVPLERQRTKKMLEGIIALLASGETESALLFCRERLAEYEDADEGAVGKLEAVSADHDGGGSEKASDQEGSSQIESCAEKEKPNGSSSEVVSEEIDLSAEEVNEEDECASQGERSSAGGPIVDSAAARGNSHEDAPAHSSQERVALMYAQDPFGIMIADSKLLDVTSALALREFCWSTRVGSAADEVDEAADTHLGLGVQSDLPGSSEQLSDAIRRTEEMADEKDINDKVSYADGAVGTVSVVGIATDAKESSADDESGRVRQARDGNEDVDEKSSALHSDQLHGHQLETEQVCDSGLGNGDQSEEKKNEQPGALLGATDRSVGRSATDTKAVEMRESSSQAMGCEVKDDTALRLQYTEGVGFNSRPRRVRRSVSVPDIAAAMEAEAQLDAEEMDVLRSMLLEPLDKRVLEVVEKAAVAVKEGKSSSSKKRKKKRERERKRNKSKDKDKKSKPVEPPMEDREVLRVYLDNNTQRFKTISIAHPCSIRTLTDMMREKMVGTDTARWVLLEVLSNVDNRILGDHELVSDVMSTWVVNVDYKNKFVFKDPVEYLSSVHKKKKKRRLSMFTNASAQSVVKKSDDVLAQRRNKRKTLTGQRAEVISLLAERARRPTVTGAEAAGYSIPGEEPALEEDVVVPTARSVKDQVVFERVANEAIQTERDYVRDLTIILDVFMKPMVKKSVVTPEQINTLFSNVQLLLGVNQEMLRQLEETMTSRGLRPMESGAVPKIEIEEQVSNIGRPFCQMAKYLVMYSEYCSNNSKAMSLLRQLQRESSAFKSFQKAAFRNRRVRNLDIGSFLIMPLQRVCKYPLLLKEMLRCTPPGHPDYEELKKATEEIGGSVAKINERKRHAEEAQRIFDIQNELEKDDFELFSPSRKYLREGEILHVYKGSKTQTVQYYMFNDLLLVTSLPKKKSGRREVLCAMKLDDAIVTAEEISGLANCFRVSKSKTKKGSIVLTSKNANTAETLVSLIRTEISRGIYTEWAVQEASDTHGAVMPFEEWLEMFGKVMRE